MAVHHFSAPDIVVARGWQPMDTFPKDGGMVEVRTADEFVAAARWIAEESRIWTSVDRTFVEWRYSESD
jgi:hypothetical protein